MNKIKAFGRKLTEFIRLHLAVTLGVTAFLMFGLGIIVGAVSAGAGGDESINVGKIGDATILPETRVDITMLFECGHAINIKDNSDFIGMTEKDFRTKFRLCDIDEFTGKNVKLSVSVSENCPEHYLLIMVDEKTLCVFRTDLETLEAKQVMTLDYDVEVFDTATADLLKNGVLFPSLEAINAYLESAET